MGNRLSKIVTRTGDDGKTHVGDRQRIFKCDVRLEALGTLDELNSHIGLLLAHNPAFPDMVDQFKQIQQDLFDLGGELCPPYHLVINAQHILRLDNIINDWNETLPPLKEFILPGGNITAAQCHVARTVCRRAERALVQLHIKEAVNAESLKYINRLSDLLFIAARLLSKEAGIEDILWDHERR
jgi:cob(I)alamin adenosyltransferase